MFAGNGACRRLAGAATISASLTAVVSCSLLKSFDGFDLPKAAVADAEAGPPVTDGGAAEASTPTCPRTSWPEPPPASAEASDLDAVVTAIDELQVLSTPSAPRGFNVDGLCTCPEVAACRGSEPSCDGDGGVDNAAAGLFEQFVAAGAGFAISDEGVRAGSRSGRYSIVIRLLGYNGRPDDPSVVVAVLNAYELSAGGDAGAPLFDGNDEWRIDRESLPDDRFALYSSSRAWVTGNELVAEIPALVVKIRVPDATGFQLIRLELADVHLKATLVRQGASYSLRDGTVAGRLPAAAMLTQLQLNKVCTSDQVYPVVKARICQIRDLPLTAAEDGRDVPCRALSFGFGFASSPAKMGPAGVPNDISKCSLVADECEN